MQIKFFSKLKNLNLNRLNRVTHRDLGYFFSSLILIYCISGIALNHIDDWNPDFIIHRKDFQIPNQYSFEQMDDSKIQSLGKIVGEHTFKAYDFPTKDQVKIYYNDASFHVNFSTQNGVYEKISRRLVFYQVNILHRNTITGWKWVSDIFALFLITITITGLFILKGKQGIFSRGKKIILLGLLAPVIALILQAIFSGK